MDFRIADTFTDSLSRLTGDEQKAVKTTAFDLQMNPVSTGMSFHKLDRAKDKNFWSVRVNADIRIIVHKAPNSLLLCYVDHHDKAYHWAERRKLETHPTTGAAQLVEIRERVQEYVVPKYVEAREAVSGRITLSKKLPLFASRSAVELLGYGVPAEWLDDVLSADEDSLLSLAGHLPSEAAEALLELAVGGNPKVATTKSVDPFEHPDAQRRFRVMKDVEALEQALAYPWEKWTTFLHPAQRQWVERDYTGPARISGSAGTGKTIVALHRAVFLARTQPDSRILLTTFSTTLANALKAKLRRLIGNEPRLGERVDVHALDAIGKRLFEKHLGSLLLADSDAVKKYLQDEMSKQRPGNFSIGFLMSEWDDIVDAWQLGSWEAYRDVKRLGRKTRLSEVQRMALWSVFDAVRARLSADKLFTRAGMFAALVSQLLSLKQRPFDFVVVDEAQDVSITQLRFLAALSVGGSNSLFFAGDLGQRIFQQPFSWKTLGVDIRGRSRTLNINYRTSHQIRAQADRLLGPEVSDVDGNTQERRGTVSVFNGPQPVIASFDSPEAESSAVSTWLKERSAEGYLAHELGIFVRSDAELSRALKAVAEGGFHHKVLDDGVETVAGHVSVGTMHLAKGLEFRGVVVMACDDEVIPLQGRISGIGDEADLEEIYNTERHLLYVACTRARDCLFVSSVEPASEFLEDMAPQ